MASSDPFRVGSRGWCTLVHQNHAKRLHHGGNVCVLVFS